MPRGCTRRTWPRIRRTRHAGSSSRRGRTWRRPRTPSFRRSRARPRSRPAVRTGRRDPSAPGRRRRGPASGGGSCRGRSAPGPRARPSARPGPWKARTRNGRRPGADASESRVGSRRTSNADGREECTPRPAGRPRLTGEGGKLCQHRQMATSPSLARSPATRRVSRPRRRGGAFGHLGDRRQGEATPVPGPRRRGIRSRRAGLPHAGGDRRSCRRSLSGPAQPPLHPHGGPAGTARGDRGQDGTRLGLRDPNPAGARHQRRQACGLQRLCDVARPR